MMPIIRKFVFLLMLLGAPLLAQSGNTLSFDRPVEGLLSTGQPAIEYHFSGEAGQFVSITMESQAFDSYLYLHDSSGTQIDEDDDSAGSLNARIGPLALPASGSYTVIATSLGSSDVGAFTLRLSSVEVHAIEYGQRVNDELTEAQPTQDFVFNAAAGDTVSIEMEANSFDTYLTLSQSSPHTELASNDDGGNGTNSRIGPYTLTNAGSYVITASSLFGNTRVGPYSLTLRKASVVQLSLGDTAQGYLTGSAPLYFAFRGQPDQVVDIRVSSDNQLESSLTLYDPQANVLGSDEDSSDGLDPILTEQRLTQTGLYFVAVQPTTSRDQRTPITLTVSESRIGALDQVSKTLPLNDLNTPRLLKFEGHAGERVTLRVQLDSQVPISPRIDLYQGGSQIAEIYGTTIVDEVSFGLVVPADGTVLIEISDYDYVDGQMTLTLER